MTTINVDFNHEVGKIKAMHAVGQPPFEGINTSYFSYLTDAHIPYSRMHDIGGLFGGNLFVDIPNIFRDFDADVNDPDSYDFAFTDHLLKGLVDHHVEPYFRLGVTIENYVKIKRYRIFPPEDYQKWAEICEHIVRHYNEGWNNGFHYGITYWEIWNEPDNCPDPTENQMWMGTAEQYYELYKTASLHLKKCFGDTIKVGGYASCGFYAEVPELAPNRVTFDDFESEKTKIRFQYYVSFFQGFLSFAKNNHLPLDFFSHHSYASVENSFIMQKYCEQELEKAGFGDVEIHLNEWNPDPGMKCLGTSRACADAVAMMIGMQNTKINVMCYYDARMRASDYGGMFDCIKKTPYALYYGFKAFGELYDMGTQVVSESDNNMVSVLAAKGKGRKGILMTNRGRTDAISVSGMAINKAYLIDKQHHYKEMETGNGVLELKKNQTLFLVE